jgi:hypothetical protein
LTQKEEIQRGEKLLDTVHDLIKEEMNTMDTDVSFAIRRVGRAMSQNGENFLIAGLDLAEFLISDRPIRRGTRLMLAELVLGELRNPPRKPQMHPSHPKVLDAVGHYDLRISEGWPPESAKHDVLQRLGVPRSTLGGYIKMVREREAAIAKAKAAIGHPK